MQCCQKVCLQNILNEPLIKGLPSTFAIKLHDLIIAHCYSVKLGIAFPSNLISIGLPNQSEKVQFVMPKVCFRPTKLSKADHLKVGLGLLCGNMILASNCRIVCSVWAMCFKTCS